MRRLVWFAAIVVVLLILEGALVVAVVFVPSTRESLTELSADAAVVWNGDGETPGVVARASTGVGNVYRSWVRPLWSVGEVPEGRPAFSKCVSCHDDYAALRLFTNVYMDHPAHEALGVVCDTCHTDVAHPNPLPPEERVCATCHTEVTETGECQTCHPPGSLAHFYLLDMPRDGYVDCNTCHIVDTFSGQLDHHLVSDRVFDGTVPADCIECHSKTACDTCHSAEHPDDWPTIHGQGVAREGQGKCQACHLGSSCSACHASTATNPFEKIPLPTGGHP